MTEPVGEDKRAHQRVGRYEIFDRIASGGMASVHLARLSGAEGFSRLVAIKRMHRHFLVDPAFKAMFVSEARVAARVRHPNVVPILDVLPEADEILIVMDYVHGESLMALTRAAKKAGTDVPVELAASVMVGLLQGLHAAHTAHDEKGRALGLVHRDVSPHNVLVGTDGVARVLDFGIAKVLQGHGDTDPGVLKGKFSYMAPELIQGAAPSRRSDLFSASVVFWELLTGAKLFQGVNDQERLLRVVKGDYPSPRSVAPHVPEVVDRIVMRGLEVEPALRHEHALAMAIELERAVPLASQRVVGEWVSELAADVLAQRSELIQEVEASTISLVSWSAPPPPPSGSLGVSGTPPGVVAQAPFTDEPRESPKQKRGLYALLGALACAVALAGFSFVRSLRSASDSSPGTGAPLANAKPLAPAPAAAPIAKPPAPAASAATTPATSASSAAPAVATASLPDRASSAKSPSKKAGAHSAKRPSGSYLPNDL
jgi:eukaryotic-like serine/threonine-protein kinase